MVDGKGEAARFCGPTAATVDRDGNFLVVDQDCAVRKVTPAGQVTTLVGLQGREPAGQVQVPELLCRPSVRAVAVAPNGDILLAAGSVMRVHLPGNAGQGAAGRCQP